MKISILTLFPEMFSGVFDFSIINNAKKKGLVEIEFINIRNFGIGKHKVVDDTPYGGGIGMVLKVDVVHSAISKTKCHQTNRNPVTEQISKKISKIKCKERVILMSASGKQFKQNTALEYSTLDHLIIICGHYEGVDERIKNFIDEDISIGDFVVTGGELPAMLITDSVVRLISGVLKKGATEQESFSYSPEDKPLLEYPQFTKPAEYLKLKVPDVLLSGNHAKIQAWRKNEALNKTRNRQELLIRPLI